MARPQVMGVINITPDSFSDGGQFLDGDSAIAHALRLIADGADILDIGGESTRPNATPVSERDELARVLPVIEAVSGQVKVSIDTMKPAIARAAVKAGAAIWNDVSALRHGPDSLAVAADLQCDVVLMHMQGEPGSMQDDPRYADVVAEVTDFLIERAHAAMAAGVAREAISLDPGIGFGKTLAHNLALLANLDRITALGFPVVLGVSRKRFIAAIDPDAKRAADRLGGSLAAALAGADKGAQILRVHDVRQTVQALKVREAIHGG